MNKIIPFRSFGYSDIGVGYYYHKMEDNIPKETNEKPSIKDNWLKEDKICPSCGQVTEKQKGLTKQSIKRLLSFNYKNPQEIIWTVVIIGMLFLAWSYIQDKKAYEDFMEHRTTYCTQLLSSIEYENKIGLDGTDGLELDGMVNNTNPYGS